MRQLGQGGAPGTSETTGVSSSRSSISGLAASPALSTGGSGIRGGSRSSLKQLTDASSGGTLARAAGFSKDYGNFATAIAALMSGEVVLSEQGEPVGLVTPDLAKTQLRSSKDSAQQQQQQEQLQMTRQSQESSDTHTALETLSIPAPIIEEVGYL